MRPIFEFDDHLMFLKHAQASYPGRKKGMPSALWSKKLGFRSPRSLEMVLSGARFPSREMVRALSDDLKLTAAEFRYFELLVLSARRRKSRLSTETLDAELQKLRPTRLNPKVMPSEIAVGYANWHLVVLRQLAKAPGFVEDSVALARKLRGKVSAQQVRDGIELLLKLRMLVRDDEGTLRPSTQQPLFSGDDVPSKAVRRLHAQMMERAKESLEEQDVTQREILSTTFRMDPSRIGEFKRALRDACDRLNEEFSSEESARVFQLNAQFFEHTS